MVGLMEELCSPNTSVESKWKEGAWLEPLHAMLQKSTEL